MLLPRRLRIITGGALNAMFHLLCSDVYPCQPKTRVSGRSSFLSGPTWRLKLVRHGSHDDIGEFEPITICNPRQLDVSSNEPRI
jgi:hypothetical protein